MSALPAFDMTSFVLGAFCSAAVVIVLVVAVKRLPPPPRDFLKDPYDWGAQ